MALTMGCFQGDRTIPVESERLIRSRITELTESETWLRTAGGAISLGEPDFKCSKCIFMDVRSIGGMVAMPKSGSWTWLSERGASTRPDKGGKEE